MDTLSSSPVTSGSAVDVAVRSIHAMATGERAEFDPLYTADALDRAGGVEQGDRAGRATHRGRDREEHEAAEEGRMMLAVSAPLCPVPCAFMLTFLLAACD